MDSKGKTTLEVGADGVAIITFVHPPSLDVLYSLKENFDEALRRNDVKAIVLTGAKGKFSGGIDNSAFGVLSKGNVQQLKPGYVLIETISDTLEAAEKPSVAAIDGLAFGGVLEVAMACHARVSTPTARLQILPGFEGTQRLPRLVGLSKALKMILTSNRVTAEQGHALGLVDAVVSPAELIDTARWWALNILEQRRPSISLYKTEKTEHLGEAGEMFKIFSAQPRKQASNPKHPIVCSDVIEEDTVSAGQLARPLKEVEASERLTHSDTGKSLNHVFLFERGTSKVPWVTDHGLVPRRVKTVAILGGGLMGSGIATAMILGNYHVILKEENEKFLDTRINRVKANLQRRVNKGKMSQEKFEKKMSLLSGVLDYESLEKVDMVIEADIEDVPRKQHIFAKLEKHCPSGCILASNTSTIDLNLIGEKTKSQNRIVGAHFFSPAHVMPLLEIVRTQHTSPQVIVDLLDVGRRIRKIPVVVSNCTGSALNRMFFPYTQAALLLVELGADVYLIDRAITKFGMLMGPFRLADLVGFGVAIASGMQFIKNFCERTYKSMIIPLMLNDKRAGETTHKGFYMYDDKRNAKPDPEIKKYIEEARKTSGVTVDPEVMKLSEKDIVEMIFFPVVNEVCRVFADGIAVKAADLDIASVIGLGFPPNRGGIMFWAHSLGSKYICSRLEEWSKLYGEFFKPCALLAERAAKGTPLGYLSESVQKRDPRWEEKGFETDLNQKRRDSYRLSHPVKQPEEKLVEEVPCELFVPLTKEEDDAIDCALSADKRGKVLVRHSGTDIDIRGQQLQCLRPRELLNDEVINLYLGLLKEREKREPQKFLKCHFFNTFFYNKLAAIGNGGYDFGAVKRWTTMKKLGYGLIGCDKIFVPIHKQMHWCLAVINRKDKKFQYLDSLKETDGGVLKNLARYYEEEVKDKSGKDIDVNDWDYECVEDLPEQENGFDCGVFMIKYVDFYSRDVGLCFDQSHMPYFRRRTAKEILKLKAD